MLRLPLRSTLGVMLLLAASILSSGRSLRRAWRFQPRPPAPGCAAADADARFAPLRRFLPARGVIGYVGEPPAAGSDSNGPLYLAQYALAPLIVVDGTERRDAGPPCDWMIADLQDSSARPTDLLRNGRYSLVRRFESGLALYRRFDP